MTVMMERDRMRRAVNERRFTASEGRRVDGRMNLDGLRLCTLRMELELSAIPIFFVADRYFWATPGWSGISRCFRLEHLISGVFALRNTHVQRDSGAV